MKKMELSLASDYVPDWTIVDAVRELFQNALDQEAQHPDNTASWSYDNETLTIRNKKSTLTTKSLLLGSTTKANDAGTIGQFGEGYKVATLVLLRNDLKVTFYNYGSKEVWRPRFVKSRRFGAEVLTFFIDTAPFWKSAPDNDLVIEIEGITKEEYEERIVPSNMYLRSDYRIIEATEYGEIIDVPGAVYVNGLFVCNYKPYTYGYNFKPGQLKLDRDRKLASDWDLRWLASKMWCKSKKVLELVESGASDVAFVAFHSSGLSEEAFNKFIDEHGALAVPVTTQAEAQELPSGYVPIIVPAVYQSLIKSSSRYVQPAVPIASPLDKLKAWYETYNKELSLAAAADDELQAIIIDFED